MRIVIAGGTPLGTATAAAMIKAGHDVVIVDRDRDRLEQLSNTHDCGLIQGDATVPSTLREAAGERADVLLALTDSDQNNVLCALVGHSIGFSRVIPQIMEPELSAVCDELGLEDVITPNQTLAASLVDMLSEEDTAEHTEHHVHLTGELRIMRIQVGDDTAGKTPADLRLDGSAKVVAIARGDEERLADDDTPLSDGDELVIVVRRADADALHDRLNGARDDE